MTYAEAIKFLYELRWFGAKFGLENTRALAARAGDLQNQLRFIHVAGTNGKGSTCAMLESIYRAAGLRVGLFTSPHLVSFRERIQVNRRLIPENDVVRLVEAHRHRLEQFPADHQPTFFEVVTVMALEYFAEQKCDLVIWETGLGGRLDATNIVTPLASVITNIGFDHQQWLGETLEKIAAEKAGIIKPGVPVVTAEDKPEALAVISQTAKSQKAAVTVLTNEVLRSIALAGAKSSEGKLRAPLPGRHQRINAALAIETVKLLRNLIPVSDEQMERGLSQVTWPGRLQLVTGPSGQEILLDGAHNTGGAAVLRLAVHENFPRERVALVLGILEDKDWRHICEVLAPLAAPIVTVPVSSERTAPARGLADACRAANPAAEVSVGASLADALRQLAGEKFVVIAGSLYLIGEAMELLGLSPVPTADEKALNNWQPASPPAKTL